jgi:hypothetical protein
MEAEGGCDGKDDNGEGRGRKRGIERQRDRYNGETRLGQCVFLFSLPGFPLCMGIGREGLELAGQM